MASSNQSVRVIVRLPYNRPEDPLPDPPRVDWTPEKEQMLWEVVDKSSATKGATTDWEGLAAHLQVPVPYLIHRTRTRFEEGLRGLQGIRTVSVSSPSVPFSPTAQRPPHDNEFFPRLPDVASRRLSTSAANAQRPLGVRARLSSLGSMRARRGSVTRNPSQRHSALGQGNMHASGSGSTSARPAKVSSSSILTLQGPRRSRGSPRRPLSPTSSHAASEADEMGDDEGSDGSDDDEAARTEEEHEHEAEARELERKLQKLELTMTEDALGLVSSPLAIRDKDRRIKNRGRTRPLSSSMASLSSAQHSASRSQRSLSSLSSRGSPHGSIPSMPSSPPRPETHARRHTYEDTRMPYAQRYEESLSPGPSSPRVASPIPRHLSPPGQSHSPPALSPNRAVGQTFVNRATPGRATGGGQGWRIDVGAAVNGGRVSSQGSEASSFSDLSDASLSASALESALASNIRGNGSRFSSFARSHLNGKRGVR